VTFLRIVGFSVSAMEICKNFVRFFLSCQSVCLSVCLHTTREATVFVKFDIRVYLRFVGTPKLWL